MSKLLYIINGPNLNLLGQREPEIYGYDTLADVERKCRERAGKHGFDVDFSQFNGEGDIVEKIQSAKGKADLIIINGAAYTHTSVAILDAMKAVDIPVIEVHISQPAARDAFRGQSFIAMGAIATISGFGVQSYLMAIDGAAQILDS